ncbi:MAG: hypothetical protein FWD92_02930 [Methanomassiliicoccaceae archaeon]|nr:hypothetical protein [Methanomassiliicoccaceae archaeon]
MTRTVIRRCGATALTGMSLAALLSAVIVLNLLFADIVYKLFSLMFLAPLALGAVFISQIFGGRNMITMDDSGLTLNHLKFGPVPWDLITKIRIHYSLRGTGGTIYVYVTDIRRLNEILGEDVVRKVIMSGRGDVSMEIGFFKRKAIEVETLMRERTDSANIPLISEIGDRNGRGRLRKGTKELH